MAFFSVFLFPAVWQTRKRSFTQMGEGAFCCEDVPCQPSAMERATCTPLAEAWDSEWVMPLPSPMIYRPG